MQITSTSIIIIIIIDTLLVWTRQTFWNTLLWMLSLIITLILTPKSWKMYTNVLLPPLVTLYCEHVRTFESPCRVIITNGRGHDETYFIIIQPLMLVTTRWRGAFNCLLTNSYFHWSISILVAVRYPFFHLKVDCKTELYLSLSMEIKMKT